MRIDLHFPTDAPALQPFRRALHQAALRQRPSTLARLTRDARARLAALDAAGVPAGVRAGLAPAAEIADLLDAPDWPLPKAARQAFVGALAYLVEPGDLVPDDEPRLGYVDDAIVVGLALEAAPHEWQAWREYRAHCADDPGADGLGRAAWLERRRALLEAAMRRPTGGDYTAPAPGHRFARERHSYLGDAASAAFGAR